MADSPRSIVRWAPGTVTERFQGRRHRIGAKALVVDGGEVLLVRERRSDGSAFWTLPGGGLGPDEGVVDGLRRELAEEIRCDAVVGDLVTTCGYDHKSRPTTRTRYLVLECSLTGEPEPNRVEGVVDAGWFTQEALPPTTLAPFERVVSANVDPVD